MPIMLNTILKEAGLAPSDVRILRHKDQRSEKGRSPYDLWHDSPPLFEAYQSTQSIKRRKILQAPYWAVFVGTPAGDTLFVGLYAARYLGLLKQDKQMSHRVGVDRAGSCDEYGLMRDLHLSEFAGRLCIAWGEGAERARVQYAATNDKRVTELRTATADPPFPGFLEFMKRLSQVEALPRGWIEILKSSRGVYLLTCPTTKEQYVGAAVGQDCFWQRWRSYVRTGHGGNVKLKSREPSDYQVSILEVAGSAATNEDIVRMEGRWKEKLQTREMGLNGN